MAIYLKVGIARTVGGMEQAGIRREADQRVGLAWSTSSGIAALLGNRIVERRNPAAHLLKLGS